MKLFYTDAMKIASSALFDGGADVHGVWESPIGLHPTVPMVYSPHIIANIVAVKLQVASIAVDVDAAYFDGCTLCVLQRAFPAGR